MNEKSKERLRNLNNLLVKKLEENFDLKVYQDSISDDEEEGFNYFIYETGDFTRAKAFTLSQEVLVRFMSENRDDLDEVTLDIIQTIEDATYVFQGTKKYAVQKGETDAFIDVIEFNFTRTVRYGC